MSHDAALQALLQARARALAAPRPTDEGEATRALVVGLADERYALETRWLFGALPRARWTRLPGAPPALLGLTPFRGEPLAVFDLRVLLGLDGATAAQAAVVLGADEPELALAVDALEGVVALRRRDLRPAPAGAAALGRVRTVGVLGDGLALLDAAALLDDPRLFVDDREPDKE
ncbi:MAG: chemotaxis protein CheW [Planctomycetes bacterium]|nr:chemotaxis protein CheW [Planctomycetota bacterium]